MIGEWVCCKFLDQSHLCSSYWSNTPTKLSPKFHNFLFFFFSKPTSSRWVDPSSGTLSSGMPYDDTLRLIQLHQEARLSLLAREHIIITILVNAGWLLFFILELIIAMIFNYEKAAWMTRKRKWKCKFQIKDVIIEKLFPALLMLRERMGTTTHFLFYYLCLIVIAVHWL